MSTQNAPAQVIGYARTSTTHQNIEPQTDSLKAAGCHRIFQERKSGKDTDRPQLQAMLNHVREGDVVMVTKLDRIARSTADLLSILETLQEKGVGFKVLNNRDLDTTSASGRMLLTILGAVATFERELMLERQRDGIEAAKSAGRYKGRKPTARAKAPQVKEMLEQGYSKAEVARRLNIGQASVYRIIKELSSTKETPADSTLTIVKGKVQ